MAGNKKQIAVNTHLWLPVMLFAVFITMVIFCIRERAVWLAIGFSIVSLFPLLAFLISPLYYVFTEESVDIIYLWGQREEIQWRAIKRITRCGSWTARGGATPHYHISYSGNQKRAFFMDGDISKTRKTEKLLHRYYGNQID